MRKTLYIIGMINLISLSVLFVSCTTQKKDQENLQKQFKTVYYLANESNRYVCIDSIGDVYDVRVNGDGSIEYKVKINQ